METASSYPGVPRGYLQEAHLNVQECGDKCFKVMRNSMSFEESRCMQHCIRRRERDLCPAAPAPSQASSSGAPPN